MKKITYDKIWFPDEKQVKAADKVMNELVDYFHKLDEIGKHDFTKPMNIRKENA